MYQIAGRVTTLETISSVLLEAQCKADRTSKMSHVPFAIWLSLLVLVEQFLFHWCHRPALSSDKTRLFCWDSDGTRANSTSSLQHSNATPRTVLITENGMKSTKVFHSATVCNTFEPFDEGHIIPTVHSMSITFSGSLCRVGSLCGGRRQRLYVAGH